MLIPISKCALSLVTQTHSSNSGSAASMRTEAEVRDQGRNEVPEGPEKNKIRLLQAKYCSGSETPRLAFHQPKI